MKNERIKVLHDQYKKQVVLQENHVKTLGHKSSNRQELISKRNFVPKQGRSSLGTSSGAAKGTQLMMQGNPFQVPPQTQQ